MFRRRTPEDRLRRIAPEMARLRREIAQIDEELLQLRFEAEDARRDAVVSGRGGDRHEATRADRQVDKLGSDRERRAARLVALETEQDELLDELGSGR